MPPPKDPLVCAQSFGITLNEFNMIHFKGQQTPLDKILHISGYGELSSKMLKVKEYINKLYQTAILV